jgi:hypothetical protein
MIDAQTNQFFMRKRSCSVRAREVVRIHSTAASIVQTVRLDEQSIAFVAELALAPQHVLEPLSRHATECRRSL